MTRTFEDGERLATAGTDLVRRAIASLGTEEAEAGVPVEARDVDGATTQGRPSRSGRRIDWRDSITLQQRLPPPKSLTGPALDDR